MWIAYGAVMRISSRALVLVALGLPASFAAAGCTTSTTPTASDPEVAAAAALPPDQQALLGSYEIPLVQSGRTGGSTSQRLRLDFVAGANGVEAYLQGNYGLGLLHVPVVLTSDKATMVFPLQQGTATLIVARKEDGRPTVAVLDGLYGQTYEGTVGPDLTPPQLSSQQSSASAPWEPTYIGFSETLRAKDIVLPPNGALAYTLAPIDGTPWVGAVGVRRPLSTTWDVTTPLQLDAIDAKDPSGNPLSSRGNFQIGVLQVGKAVKAYDFAKDSPAFPQVVNRLVADCDAGAEACLRVSLGAKIGLRVAAGSRTLRLRYALRAGQFKDTAPKPTVLLTGVVAPGDGSATSALPKLEVSWAAIPSPTPTRAFATAYADLLIPLPKLEAETGISLTFGGEPRDTSTPGASTGPTPSNPTGTATVEARHMVLLLQSARAE